MRKLSREEMSDQLNLEIKLLTILHEHKEYSDLTLKDVQAMLDFANIIVAPTMAVEEDIDNTDEFVDETDTWDDFMTGDLFMLSVEETTNLIELFSKLYTSKSSKEYKILNRLYRLVNSYITNTVNKFSHTQPNLTVVPLKEGELTFNRLQQLNALRSKESFLMCNNWVASDWSNALAGEVGEACNLIKKYRRGDDIKTSDIGLELADVIFYALLTATYFSIDIEDILKTTFNSVSDKIGSDIKL